MAKTKEAKANGAPPSEGPLVLQALNKRLRNARKRLRGIEEIQAKADAGKELNPDQEAALISRPAVLAVIDELERLLPVLEGPLKEDLETASAAGRAEGAAAAEAAAAAAAAAVPPVKSEEEWEREKRAAVATAKDAATAKAKDKVKSRIDAAAKKAAAEATAEAVHALTELLYVVHALDPYANPWNDRVAVLYAAQQTGAPVNQDLLDNLAMAVRVISLRPMQVPPMSHADAMVACKEVASRLISDPSAELHPVLPGVTGTSLREAVEAIKALDFFGTPSGAGVTANGGVAADPSAGLAAAAMAPAVVAPTLHHVPSAGTMAALGAGAAVFVPAVVPAGPVPVPVVPVAPTAVPEDPSKINLLEKLFGAYNSQPQAHQAQQQHPHLAQYPQQAPVGGGGGDQVAHLKNSGPPAFSGDLELGIEGIDSELEGTDGGMEALGGGGGAGEEDGPPAPAPGSVPAPSPAVLTVPVPANRRNTRGAPRRGGANSVVESGRGRGGGRGGGRDSGAGMGSRNGSGEFRGGRGGRGGRSAGGPGGAAGRGRGGSRLQPQQQQA